MLSLLKKSTCLERPVRCCPYFIIIVTFQLNTKYLIVDYLSKVIDLLKIERQSVVRQVLL